jgi:hypothetical protein
VPWRPSLRKLGQEAADRYLAPREKARVGGVLAIAAAEIGERIKNGEKVRTDDFFKENSSGRSSADEVAENVLLKSQKEAEERKIPYMGYLLSNIAFDATISASMAHQIIKTAEALTYRQLCILKLAAVKHAFALRKGDYRNQGSFAKELYQILYECLDLYHRGLINFGGSAAFGPTDVNPAGLTIQGLGTDIYNLMSLGKIPDGDLFPIAFQLK